MLIFFLGLWDVGLSFDYSKPVLYPQVYPCYALNMVEDDRSEAKGDDDDMPPAKRSKHNHVNKEMDSKDELSMMSPLVLGSH
jgi:hypothetical protein